MGCFSSSQPTYNPPAPPTLPTADQLFTQGTNYAKTNDPLAYGAREGALSDLQNPTAYYSSFQPTSFEQALGNQSFQNIWPDQQAYMANILSKSGMAYSPVAAQTMGNAYGNLATNIGQYLNTQADNRANQSLTARLGIDPMSMVNPFVQTGQQQGNAQANLDYGYSQAQAQQQYQQAMNQYNQQQSMAQFLGFASPVAGNIYNATQGNLGTGLSGSMQALQYGLPLLTGGVSGFGSIFGSGSGNGSGGNNIVGQLPGFGGGTSNDFNSNGGAGRATSVYPNLSLS